MTSTCFYYQSQSEPQSQPQPNGSSSSCSVQLVLGVARQLYKSGQNLLFSPYSLTSALVMLLAGTDHATKSRAELINALFGDDDHDQKDVDVNSFARLNKTNMTVNAATLSIANLLYSAQSHPLNHNYVTILTEQLYAICKELDFEHNPTNATMTINSDVARATRGFIKQLLTSNSSISPETGLILVNVIHFRGVWAKEFDRELTNESGQFRTSKGAIVRTPMMYKRHGYLYYEADGVKAVEMDYQLEGNVAMVVILPTRGSIETYLNQQLTVASLNHILENLNSGFDVNLTLPRFKLAATHQLVPALTRLGVRDIFDPSTANLSRITSSRGLFVSDMIQKAVIEVAEEGTEAAAATAAQVELKWSTWPPPQEANFTADRPFIFALVSRGSATPKQVFFMGVVEDPNQE